MVTTGKCEAAWYSTYTLTVSQHFFRVSSISEYPSISEIIDDTKQVIIIPAALLLYSHLVPSLKFKPNPPYQYGNIKDSVHALMFWVWIFGQAHLQVIAMKSDEIKSLNLKIAEFLINSDSLTGPP